jgi:hypothetical protein
MPTITLNDLLNGGARGLGMQIKVAPENLARLAELKPGEAFDLTYEITCQDAGAGASAQLQVRLNDPSDLFAGHSIVAVLGNLLAQIVEARLDG